MHLRMALLALGLWPGIAGQGLEAPTDNPHTAALQASAGKTGPSRQAGDQIWITLGADAAPVVRRTLAEMGRESGFQVVRVGRGVAAARLDIDLIETLSNLMHDRFHRCGGFMRHPDVNAAWRAVAGPRDGSAKRRAFSPPSLDSGELVDALAELIEEDRIVGVITALSSFHTRFYTQQSGEEAALWLHGLWSSLAAGRDDAGAALYPHAGFDQPSVVLTIQGALFPDEYVVLGGHLDSTVGPWSPGGRAPGADDNASGIAVLSETARLLLESGFQPERTIQIMGYAAEEVGLVGSQRIADDYAAAQVNVLGVLQLDMVNYAGPNGDIAIITDFTDSGQNEFVRLLVDQYATASWVDSSCGYACSDHASWTRAGFPASFPFEAPGRQFNPWIHTASDTLAQSGNRAEHALKFAELAIAYAVEMAKGRLIDGPELDDWFTMADLANIVASFGPCPGLPKPCPGDADGNGVVNGADLTLRLPEWNRPKVLPAN